MPDIQTLRSIKEFLEGVPDNPIECDIKQFVSYASWGPRIDAEEALQDSHKSLLEYLRSRKDSVTNLKGLTWRVVKNICLMQLRKKFKEESVFEPVDDKSLNLPSPQKNPEELLIAKEQKQLFHAALSKMDHICQRLIELKGLWECSYQEIAKILNLDCDNARVKYFRCIKKFGQLLLEMNVEGR